MNRSGDGAIGVVIGVFFIIIGLVVAFLTDLVSLIMPFNLISYQQCLAMQ